MGGLTALLAALGPLVRALREWFVKPVSSGRLGISARKSCGGRCPGPNGGSGTACEAGSLLGHKFRRQVPIGPYFADFACLEARLVVEVDGDHHGDQLVYDARRDRRLSELGFGVLRFWVAEVDENIEGVIDSIADALSTSHLPAPPPTSPRNAGGGRL